MHGGGNVVFQRDWFIHETSRMVLEKSSLGYRSYYWRAPVGSGKSVFLKLMGRKLQSCGCDVYLTIASELHRYSKGYFTKLAKEAGQKTVVLLIDEVQNDMKTYHWNALLKELRPSNLLVIGVGVPQLNAPSPQFDYKYPSDAILFPFFCVLGIYLKFASISKINIPKLPNSQLKWWRHSWSSQLVTCFPLLRSPNIYWIPKAR